MEIFSIDITDGKMQFWLFLYIGFITQEVSVLKRKYKYNFIEAPQLNWIEVVVQGGNFGTSKKTGFHLSQNR